MISVAATTVSLMATMWPSVKMSLTPLINSEAHLQHEDSLWLNIEQCHCQGPGLSHVLFRHNFSQTTASG